MSSKKFYNGFKFGVEACIKTILVLIISLVISPITHHFVTTFLITFVIYLALEALFALDCGGYKNTVVGKLADNIFDSLYFLNFEKYKYSVKERILNDGTKLYFPMVKICEHYPWFYIKHNSYTCWLDSSECEPLETNEDALYIIKRYISQEQNKKNQVDDKEVNEENIINVSIER